MPDSGTAAKLLWNNKLQDRLSGTPESTGFHRSFAVVYCYTAPKYQGFWGVLLVALLATMSSPGLLSGAEPEPKRSVPDLDELWTAAERQTPAVAKASVQTQRWQRPLTEIPIKDSRDSGRYPADLSTEIPAAAGENVGVGALRQPWSRSAAERQGRPVARSADASLSSVTAPSRLGRTGAQATSVACSWMCPWRWNAGSPRDRRNRSRSRAAQRPAHPRRGRDAPCVPNRGWPTAKC